jgi:glycosyltransferase involved in cell wall biosynthesis
MKIIISDGGSTDETVAIARENGAVPDFTRKRALRAK